MAYLLEMDKNAQLHSAGMAKRRIARILGIDRKSVDRHLAELYVNGDKKQQQGKLEHSDQEIDDHDQ